MKIPLFFLFLAFFNFKIGKLQSLVGSPQNARTICEDSFFFYKPQLDPPFRLSPKSSFGCLDVFTLTNHCQCVQATNALLCDPSNENNVSTAQSWSIIFFHIFPFSKKCLVALLTVRTLCFLSSIYKQLQNNNYNQTLPTPTPSKSQRSTTQIFIAEFGWLSAEMLTLSTKEGPIVSGVGRVTDTQWSLKNRIRSW